MADGPTSGGSSASKSLLWMMLALFAGLGILVGGGLFLASRVVKTAGLTATSPRDTVNTPSGSFRLEKEGQVGPGMPLYPRAALVLPGDDAATQAIKERQTGYHVVTYHCIDSRDFVDRWYGEHLGAEFVRHDAGDKSLAQTLPDAPVTEKDIAFVGERGSQVRIVALSPDSTGTRISLIRFDKQPDKQPAQ